MLMRLYEILAALATLLTVIGVLRFVLLGNAKIWFVASTPFWFIVGVTYILTGIEPG